MRKLLPALGVTVITGSAIEVAGVARRTRCGRYRLRRRHSRRRHVRCPRLPCHVEVVLAGGSVMTICPPDPREPRTPRSPCQDQLATCMASPWPIPVVHWKVPSLAMVSAPGDDLLRARSPSTSAAMHEWSPWPAAALFPGVIAVENPVLGQHPISVGVAQTPSDACSTHAAG
jgi:hypothetical protein